MNLHTKDQAAVETTLSEICELYADRVLAVVIHGEAVSSDYRPRKSPLTLAIVLEAVTPEELAVMQPRIKRWRRRRIPTPLVLDPRYIETSIDVFPLEFIDLMDRHHLLHGDTDPFAAISVETSHLRTQVEAQLRGKMLHLWEAFLGSAGSWRVLRRVLLETTPDFETALRGLLMLGGSERPQDALQLLVTVESRFELSLVSFRRLEEIRHGAKALARDELGGVFARYLDEVRALVRVVDAL